MPDRGSHRIVIGDSDRSAGESLARLLQKHGYPLPRVLCDGVLLLEEIQQDSPDLVIIDLLLERMDGFAVIEALEASQGKTLKPRILVYSAIIENDIMMRIYARGAGFLPKPAAPQMLLRKVKGLLAEIGRVSSDNATYQSLQRDEARRCIAKSLKELGFSPKLMGYRYLTEGVALILDDSALLKQCTTRLYPTLAKRFGSTANRVERCMRYSVEAAFERGSIKDIEAVFGYTIDLAKGKPTNSEFLAMLADHLLINGRINTYL